MSTLKPTTVKPESRSIKFGRGLRDLLSSKRHSRTSSSPNAQSLDNFETNSTQEWAHKPSINIEESVEPLVPTIDIGALLYSHASSHLTSVQSRQSLRSHNSKGSLASNHVDPHSERQWKKAYEIAMEKLDEKEKLQVDQDKISSYTVYSVLEIADRALADQEEKKWRYTKKNGEVVVLKERFDNIIKGFTKYADCIGITVQHQPEVTSLVWAAARFLIQIYLNYKESVEMLEDALRTIAVSMANCEFYASIFADALHRQFTSSETSAAWEKQLETALPEFYAAVIIFSIKVKRYFISSNTGRMANSFKPFSIAFRAHLEQIENKEKRLKELAGMATMEGVRDIRQKMEILGEMKEIFVQISDKEALTWLNAIRPDPVYNFNKFRRLEGTCEWIFEAQKYQSWIDRTGSRDLWVVGIPGAGKSVLATHIIDKLRERDDSLTLYFLFRDGDSQTVSPLEMVARIIAQLIDSDIDKERLMRVLKLRVQSSLHFTNKATESREFEKLCAALIEMLRGFPMPVIIVLDALDECSDPSSVPRHLLEPANNPSSIAHMMLMPDTGEKIQVQFLLTGRPNVHDIFAPLRYVSTLDMDVNEDIRKFINEKVADNEGLRRHESQIVATIYENTQGMFRYAALVLEELNEPSPEPISERLKAMPKGVTGMYELILSRLGSRGSTWEHKMRQKLLLWVTLAQRSIKVPEMQYAFATIEGRKSFDPDVVVLPSAKQMLSSCGSLLEVSKEDELRFTHRTVKEFLLQPLEKLSEDARKNENITSCMVDEAEGHASMAITCVTQLFSKGIKQLASIISTEPWNDEEFAAEMKMQFDQKGLLPLAQSPFNYAVSYWLKHAMDVPHGIQSTPRSRELWELVRDFFWDQDGIIFKEWVRVLDPYHDSWHTKPMVPDGSVVRCLYPWHKPHITSGLHVAASYGLVDIIEWAHPDGVDFEIRTSPHNSPLVEAACKGEDDVVKALLSKDNVDPNWSACRMSTIGECLEAECKNGWFTPLVAAIRYQRLGVIKLLLKQPGINVDLVSHGNTPLGVAVDDKYPEFIELLVGAGAKLAMRYGDVIEIPQAPYHFTNL